VAAAIAQTKGFEGVTGVITLDAHHDAVKPAVVLEVKGGKVVYVTTIAPAATAPSATTPASSPR
jgi:branched-chain amino acid transport system substrate-binding protein